METLAVITAIIMTSGEIPVVDRARFFFNKSLRASKPSNQSKGLDGNISCRDKSSTLY